MASTTVRLYAWARPSRVTFGIGDHTFLTTFRAPFALERPPTDSWFCAGGVYSSDDPSVRLLFDTAADAVLARRICASNDPEATAGILYGVTGVCHQIANRVLYASVQRPPPLVSAADQYPISRFFYRDYGLDEANWRERLPI